MLKFRPLEKGHGDPRKTRCCHTCYRIKFGRCRSNCVGVRRGTENMGTLGLRPIGMGAWLTLKHAPAQDVLPTKYGRSRSNRVGVSRGPKNLGRGRWAPLL